LIRVNSLRLRLVLLLIMLLGVVQISAFLLITAAADKAARLKIDDELAIGERAFARQLHQNVERELQAAKVLVADFAFREAVASGDVATMQSALENQRARIQAAALVLTDLSGMVIASSLRSEPLQWPDFSALLRPGPGHGDASSIMMIQGHAFQLIAAPVRAPITIGWVIVGFDVDQEMAQDLRQLTGLNVSFAVKHAGQWQLLVSTLPSTLADSLRHRLPEIDTALPAHALEMPDGQHQFRVVQIGGRSGEVVVAVLQRRIADAMGAFSGLRLTLLALGFLSVILSIVGSALIALGITRPLSALLETVRRIRGGDYTAPVDVQRSDEIGVLAQGLDHMRAGIAEREQRILRLAYEDSLTKLPNRARFAVTLQDAIAKAREADHSFAVLVMDLDRFRFINDTLGHGVGDHVLRQVAERLGALLNGIDCVARLGGDEFAALVNTQRKPRLFEVTQAIGNAMELPILYDGQPLDVSVSVGIALYPLHDTDADGLVRKADIAMYVAKSSRTGHALYDAVHDTNQQEHLSLLGELRHAVDHNELHLLYQPKVTLATSATVAAEALIRWKHPQRGIVAPAIFIPFAEHTGYIKTLTRWVLKEAICQCGEWRRAGLHIQVSINLSTRDLMSRDLPEIVAGMLAQHGVPAQQIALEITESGFMEDPAHALQLLERLAAMGLQLSIDDYGTGYSSLTYLMKLPVKELKIDRSFVARLSEDSNLRTIVRSTIELGHSLGMKVVAEGVEDSRGYALLQQLQCDSAQGYYMSPPLAPADFQAWINGGPVSLTGMSVAAAISAPVEGAAVEVKGRNCDAA
jgi:diguanylate cyclase (GGDEF)-like protein